MWMKDVFGTDKPIIGVLMLLQVSRESWKQPARI